MQTKIYKRREKIIEVFKNGIVPFQLEDDRRFEDDDENDIRGRNGLFHHEKLDRLIDLKRRSRNDELLIEYFKY